jgi:hypothetical protein|uniref:sialidase family protein n=1 Tax=Prosthecobacter sp. TaxID=1965333 RepID=UPI003782D823
MSLRSLSCFLAISCSAFIHAADVPTFAGPTPGTLRTISIPTVDISADAARHVIIARGTEKEYQGHCDTVLMADGRAMFTAWCMNHAGHLGPLARSDDGGLTWTSPLSTPPDWQLVKKTTPVLHRLTDPQGVERLFIFGGCDFPGNLRSAFSTDLGKTWSPMKELGLVGEVAPKSILSFDGGKRLVMWSDRRDPKNAKDPHPVVWQSESLDGGLTWSKERVILIVPGQWAQPSVTRSDDEKQLVMLLRENTRQHHSLYSISTDDARTWSEPKELPAALTGDRHVFKHAPDGRLVIAFRDMAKTSATYGHYVAWVGTFEDIVNRREGQYRIKLLHNANHKPSDLPGTGNTDCGYSDLELLGDGTLIATTYIQYAAGPEKSSVVSTRFKLSETDALAKKAIASTKSLLPANWDPALAGDIVMQGLVRVSAPQVKGAHDAEFVCVGERAYLVEHDNDVSPGHGAGAAMYCVLSVVNLKTLQVEKTHLLAKAGQAFANVTLPQAQVFVPRIIRKDEHTLRTYFCSKSASELTWYRDFDLRTQSFEDSIHKAKLKTAAGTFDMEPRHFHADAAALGFKRPAVNHGLYIFDSFKEFDGRRYVALNNFPGKQNALAVLHDDFTTFEVIGHYNEPQSQQLSESAVNRLPDGTWMAIVRNDAGNYHFTTSQDGKTWTAAEPKPFVPNGLNSKPTFDKFGGVYYLGWQENTKIQNCNRSVFNVDISRDGKTWQRKYRFESPHSFQYPTFHEHEGTLWLTVSQSDHGGSTDRIMFGKLEAVGDFESQKGQKRIEWPAPPPPAPAVMKRGVTLFTDRDYVIDEMPAEVRDRLFLRTSIEKCAVEVKKPGVLFALTPTIRPGAASQDPALLRQGFTKVNVPEVQLFPGEINRVSLYQKTAKAGERLRFTKMVVLIMGEGCEIGLYEPKAPNPWPTNNGEKLYNGIVLPKVWPPEHYDQDSAEPMPVPYVQHPPKVIPIDVGRQLFVDDFLIESSTLKRTFHTATKFSGNPVFKAETKHELGSSGGAEGAQEAVTYLGHGGVFYDPSVKLFKMFYTAGWRGPLALATSPDLKKWTRPSLGIREDNLLRDKGNEAGGDNCVWLDLASQDARIKFMTDRGKLGHQLQTSADGREWTQPVFTGPAGDYCSFFFNPFRERWVYSIKQGSKQGRNRWYHESRDFIAGADWSKSVFWANADRLDLPDPQIGKPAQLYSLSAVAYESVMLGMFQIHLGPDNKVCDAGKFPKITELKVGFSRDGFHWDRPDRRAFIAATRREGDWDRAYLHTTAGVCVVLDDQLVFPYCAYSGIAPNGHRGMYCGGSIGLATLRRDGFASMDGSGELMTRSVQFKGKHLFVNVNGELRVELLNEAGEVVTTSKPISGDHTKAKLELPELLSFVGKPVRFRFHLTKGSLYAFWVTDDASGASHGFVGAGGPQFNGVRDISN